MSKEQKIVIIAGPNGAGKTTFAREFLVKEADCPVFVNADLIAAGLSPFTPEQAAIKAGRLMLEEIRGYVERRATQKETLASPEKDYGTDATDEIFKALKDELRRSPQ